MAVNVRIKQKSFFKKKLKIKKLIKMTGLDYGVMDDYFRLERNKIGNPVIIYDKRKLARGIEMVIDNKDVLLKLNFPATKEEIRHFYHTIEIICSYLKVKDYIRDEEQVCIEDSDMYIKMDEECSISSLEYLQECVETSNYNVMFGVYNPISLGRKEMEKIQNNLESFSEFLHELQSVDAYYAVPEMYNVNDRLIGMYIIGPNIKSIVPLEHCVPKEPFVELNNIKSVEEWYVLFGVEKAIKYTDFINNIDISEYYDAGHVIVTLSDIEIHTLLAKYLVDMDKIFIK